MITTLLLLISSFAYADTRTPVYLDAPQSIGNNDCGDGHYCLHTYATGTYGPPPTTDCTAVDTSGATCSNLCDKYKFYRGGCSGTLLRTTTIMYTDTGKSTLSTISKVDSQ